MLQRDRAIKLADFSIRSIQFDFPLDVFAITHQFIKNGLPITFLKKLIIHAL